MSHEIVLGQKIDLGLRWWFCCRFFNRGGASQMSQETQILKSREILKTHPWLWFEVLSGLEVHSMTVEWFVECFWCLAVPIPSFQSNFIDFGSKWLIWNRILWFYSGFVMAIACQNQPQKSRKLFPKAVKYLPILIYEDSDQIVCPTTVISECFGLWSKTMRFYQRKMRS